MKQGRLYDEFAHLWPLLSPPEDYAGEAQCWREVLRKKLGPGRHEILELGVGGGHNLSHLKNEFKATAVDLSKKMLQNSINLNPEVEHHVGDMRSIRLGRKFKAVPIHDAINHMLSEEDLRSAFATAAAHLDPGGVFVAAPDFLPGRNGSSPVPPGVRKSMLSVMPMKAIPELLWTDRWWNRIPTPSSKACASERSQSGPTSVTCIYATNTRSP